MKQTFLLLTLVIATTLAAQTDTIPFGERVPNYYYWDTNWWDHYRINYDTCEQEFHEHTTFHHGMFNDFVDFGQMIFARPIIADSELTIIGIASTCFTGSFYSEIEDSNLNHLLPEYFRLYKEIDNEMTLLRETRWDTASPAYTLCLGHVKESNYYDERHVRHERWKELFRTVREAYFEQPVTVRDTFYVAGTNYNNYLVPQWHHIWFDTIEWIGYFPISAHPTTSYTTTVFSQAYNNGCFHSYPQYIKVKACLIDEYNGGVYNSRCWVTDTNWHDYPTGDRFLHIFPIFDTGTFHHADIQDTCPPVRNLRTVNTGFDNATLIWNGPENAQFDVVLHKYGNTDPDTALTTSLNFVTLTGLDSACHYSVTVRTLCSDTLFSRWSDTVTFYIPGDTATTVVNPPDTTLSLSLADSYTYIQPNPATDAVTIISSFSINSVELYKSDGTLLLSQPVNAISATIDIRGIPKGLYIIRITTPAGTSTKRLVVN